MANAKAIFPGGVWDGTSKNPTRKNRLVDSPPSQEDWDQIVAEVIAIESAGGGAGTPGADGATWRTGAGAPLNGTGVDGDLYFRTATDDVYQRASGVYAIIANLKGSAGTNGTGGSPHVATVFANSTVSNGGNLQGAMEDVDGMTLTITTGAAAVVVVHGLITLQATNTHFTVFGARFDLDNGASDEGDLILWSAEIGNTNNEKRTFGWHHVFTGLPAGSHTIKMQGWGEGSAQVFNIYDRRLTIQY